MKEGKKFTRVVTLILLVGVLLYLGIYAVRSLNDPFTTTIAYLDTLDDSLDLDGVVVREEETLSGGGGTVNVVASEGGRVAVGEEVAQIYQDSGALENQQQLTELEQELEQLNAILSSSALENQIDLERQVLQAILNLREQAAGGKLSALGTSAQTLRTLTLQYALADSSSEDDGLSETISQAIEELEAQIAALSAQSSGGTSSLTSSSSGLFSQIVDGLEQILTPEALLSMSPSQLETALSAPGSTDGLIGKIVTGDSWYYAAVITEEQARELTEGEELLLVFSSSLELSVEVEQLGAAEDGQLVLTLSSNRSLTDVLALREQTAELVLERYEGIRVPQKALRIEEETTVDEETGESVTVQVTGVYTVVGAQAQFNPVEIVAAGSDYYLVTPATEDSGHLLRAGDEVIVRASGLYDGKVVVE
ncbi:MAG: hypothetical protein LUD69_06505 [Oscillospiraceae bacterium]|nr:hypothetical protein [Oscillospiraceae bacterium]